MWQATNGPVRGPGRLRIRLRRSCEPGLVAVEAVDPAPLRRPPEAALRRVA